MQPIPQDPAALDKIHTLAVAGRARRLLRQARQGRVGENPDGLESALVDEIAHDLAMWDIDRVTTNPRHVSVAGKPSLHPHGPGQAWVFWGSAPIRVMDNG
jgi:hypothetical protein